MHAVRLVRNIIIRVGRHNQQAAVCPPPRLQTQLLQQCVSSTNTTWPRTSSATVKLLNTSVIVQNVRNATITGKLTGKRDVSMRETVHPRAVRQRPEGRRLHN